MENAIVKHDPNVSLSLQKVAQGLFQSGMFPNAKNAYGAFAIVEYGHELGIPPMMALKNINIISGQLACNAQLMLSLAMQRGVTYKVIKETDKGAEIIFKRGDSEYTATFTEEDCKLAGLAGKDNWKKYGKDMMFWRCVARGLRRIAPDAILGLYTKDEISNGEIVDVIPSEILPLAGNEEKVEPEAKEPLKTPIPDDIPAELGNEPAEVKLISQAQGKRLFAISMGNGWSTNELKAYLTETYGIGSSKDIPVDIYDKIIEHLQKNNKVKS